MASGGGCQGSAALISGLPPHQPFVRILYFKRYFLLILFVAQPGVGRLPPVIPQKGYAAGGSLRVMWYNTENLFHPSDDTLAGDDEFTPPGARHWTFPRYRKKLTSVARVIIAAGGWEAPEIVGLGEIENGAVLEDLIAHPLLKPFGYSYLHRDSPDHRGMDVACLFRPELFHPAGWSAIDPPEGGKEEATRQILHIWGTWGKGDTLDLFLVHFISRYRGPAATAGYRAMQSARMVMLADSVAGTRPGSLVLIGGDFNESWEGYSMAPFRSGTVSGESLEQVRLSGPTYKYHGEWETIDWFITGGDPGGWLIKGSVISFPAMLVRDETYGGEKPYRTYQGMQYTGGFSDHLPVLLEICRPFSPADFSQ
jgi:hypothetical protein